MRCLLVAIMLCGVRAAEAQEAAEPDPPPLMIRIVPRGGGSRLDAAYARQDILARRVIASVCTGCGVSLPEVSPDKAALAATVAPPQP